MAGPGTTANEAAAGPVGVPGAGAACVRHADRPALPCARCGTFSCAECLEPPEITTSIDGRRWCTRCLHAHAAERRDLAAERGLRLVIAPLVVVTVVASALAVNWCVVNLWWYPQVHGGRPSTATWDIPAQALAIGLVAALAARALGRLHPLARGIAGAGALLVGFLAPLGTVLCVAAILRLLRPATRRLFRPAYRELVRLSPAVKARSFAGDLAWYSLAVAACWGGALVAYAAWHAW